MNIEETTTLPPLAFMGGTKAMTLTPVVGTPKRECSEMFVPDQEELEDGGLRVTILGSGNPWPTRAQASAGTLRYAFAGKILASNRNRFELRWVNRNFHWRYRNRARFEHPVNIPFKRKKKEITPFGGAEAVWDQRYQKWSIFKFTGGVQIPLVRRTSLGFLYERQECVTCSDRSTNIFGLTLNVYFRLKEK